LQHWDFSGDVDHQLSDLRVSDGDIEPGEEGDREKLCAEIRGMLQRFVASDFYERLCRATIMGREVPFLMPWANGTQILEGVIDVVYRLDGRLWIADYKTDMIAADQLAARAEHYGEQARLYVEAVRSCLREPVGGFEFMFLRHGVSISLSFEPEH
jgi:ATP-dependent helicase/nuclease subunit A